MTLLLTSAGMDVEDEIVKLLPKPANKTRVAHVITAGKVEKDQSYIKKDRKKMVELGLQVVDIDIEGKTEDELRREFERFDVIMVQGGNTYYLMKQIRSSGFEPVIREFINRGGLYIGVSAGTIVAGPDISISSPFDKNIYGVTDFTGMGLVDAVVSPHYEPSDEADVSQYEKRTGRSVIRLTDKQALLIQNEKQTIVGS